jgi:hypothetical protein
VLKVSNSPSDDAAATPAAGPPLLSVLDAVAAEIDAHLAGTGWDQRPMLYALVPTLEVAAQPGGADLLGLEPGADIPADSVTPFAQEELPDTPLDEFLAGIEWPESVTGCALAQEILILPPTAEDELTTPDAVGEAAAHPERREARLVVAVLRDGRSASVLRLRARAGPDDERDEIAFGADLAPNLREALLATLV